MKNKIKIITLLLLLTFVLTGCTTQLRDNENNIVQNPETGQNLPEKILCRPTDEKLVELYTQHADFAIEELPRCENMRIRDANRRAGLWDQIFVIPLAWYIIRIAGVVGNYGIALMLAGIAIRVLLTPMTIKTMRQSQNMKKAQPELAKLEQKYKDKKDQESMMMKSREMLAIHKKHNVSLMGSCLNAFLQLPLFLAFFGAINRTPAIFEETLWTLNLGMTPRVGLFEHGNYLYLVLILLIVITTYASFKFNMTTMTANPDQQKMQKTMFNIMIVMITVMSFSLPTAIALYWIVSSSVMVVMNLIFKRQPKETK